MFRLMAVLTLIFLSQLTYAEVDSGRFEVSELGETYWLPSWLSRNIFYDFKNQLIEVKSEKVETANPDQCKAAYQRLYQKSDIRWSIFFGYGDGDGETYTTDYAERDLLEKEIKSLCPVLNPEIQFCGFTAKENAGEYIRQIRTKNNEMVNVHLRLFNASLTSEIEKNMHGKKQKRKSKSLEKAYIEALQTDDIVFYSGHARHGAGPGFRPLVKKSKDWWVATLFRPMVNEVLQTLNPNMNNNEDGFPSIEKPVINPAVIGMFSCEAEAHFGYSFATNSESSLILTRQSISSADNLRLLYAASNALLAEECEEDFHLSMREAITKVYYRKDKRPPRSYEKKMPKTFNFFHKDEVKYKHDLVLYFQNKDEQEMDISTANEILLREPLSGNANAQSRPDQF